MGDTPDEIYSRRQRVGFLMVNTVLLFSAQAVLVGYVIFLTKIIPPLNLFETGNWWTFALLYLSCVWTIIVTGYAIFRQCCTKRPITRLMVVLVTIALLAGVMMILLVSIGAIKEDQQRGEAKKATTFGNYINSVCGNGTTSEEGGVITIHADKTVDVKLIQEKCDATTSLRTAIFCMYIWAAELLIVAVLSILFVMKGTCRRRGTPE